MVAPERYFQSVNFTELQSPITGNKLHVNGDQKRFLIPPTYSTDMARLAVQECVDFYSSKASSYKPSVRMRSVLDNLLDNFNDANLFENLELVIDLARDQKTREGYCRADQARAACILTNMWHRDCLAFPLNIDNAIPRLKLTEKNYGLAASKDVFIRIRTLLLQRQMHVANKETGRDYATMRIRPIVKAMVTAVGVKEIGDLLPAMFMSLDGEHWKNWCIQLLLDLDRAQYGSQNVPFEKRDFFKEKSRGRGDPEFMWTIEEDKTLDDWRGLAAEFVSTVESGLQPYLVGLNQFFDWFVSNADLPRDPGRYLWGGSIFPPFNPKEDKYFNRIVDFLDFVLKTRFSTTDAFGNPRILDDYRNPLTKKTKKNRKPQPVRAQTVREAMPTRFVEELKTIITENDFRWPRERFGGNAGPDICRCLIPETQQWELVWSPVRAYAILLKLLTPYRTFQVRMLNSGEADAEVYDIEKGLWVPNTHPLTGQAHPPMGILRKMRDDVTGEIYVGSYINTNKTADVDNDERGYEIPYCHPEVLAIASKLRQWQQRYNPVQELTPWVDIAESATDVARYNPNTLKQREAETFLFRDPCAEPRSHPVSDARLVGFWNALMEELDRRLRATGEIDIPLVFYKGGQSTVIARCRYNMHTTRVYWITAMAEKGVPLSVLIANAGHCSTIMNLYYQKHGREFMSQCLTAAEVAVLKDEQVNLTRWLTDQQLSDLETLVAYNASEGLTALADSTHLGTIQVGIGICPCAGTRCNEGGPLAAAYGQGRYEPVPGPGARNCARCRFFVTGPLWIEALRSRFEAVGHAHSETSEMLENWRKRKQELMNQRARCLDAGEPFTAAQQLDGTHAEVERYMAELDAWSKTWHALWNLMQQCAAITKNPELKQDGRLVLITAGHFEDLEIALESDDDGEREFELLHRIGKAAVIYEGVDPRPINLKRMRHLGRMLALNKIDSGALFMLDDDQLQFVTDQIGEYLMLMFEPREAPAEVAKLMRGEKFLRDIGIDQEAEMREIVARFSEGPIRLTVEHPETSVLPAPANTEAV